MPLDLLDTPIRATWALSSDANTPAGEVVSAITQQLIAAGVFYLLLQPPSLKHPAWRAVLNDLAAGGCQTEIICRGDEDELLVLEERPLQHVGLWLDVTRFLADEIDIDQLKCVVQRLQQSGLNPGLLCPPFRQHLLKIPQLINLCEILEIERFKLPNIGIDVTYQSSDCVQLPRSEDLAALKKMLKNTWQAPSQLRLEVHDLFLWELLVPDAAQGREEYGGCQAANSLVHVTAQGDVYPCISWPEKLGSLLTSDLGDIWESEQRLRIRREIAHVPSGCNGCLIVNDCHGGCRGLSRIFNKGLGQRDLLCSGKR